MGEAMNLLADLYSTIDSKKRQLKGLLSDPVETIRQGLLNFRDDQNKLLNDFGVGYQTPGYKSVLATPEQIKAAQQSVADWGANQGIGAATVWHGSPHKFNKFDSSKIGTGEGAQAYGHGLYFAEAKDVAESYMGGGSSIGGRAFETRLSNLMEKAQDAGRYGEAAALEHLLTNRNPAIARQVFSIENGYDKATVDQAHAVINKYADKFKPAGLYKVDLPDEAIAKMLDWDKPLSQQSPEVLRKVKELERFGTSVTDADWSSRFFSPQSYGDMTGAGAVGVLQKRLGEGGASDFLKQQGIPGIRYLDGGSRGAGSGTSNYVIFPGNESLLTILERNGQPVGLLD